MLKLSLSFALATLVAAQDPGTSYRYRIARASLTPAQHELLEREFDFLHNDNKDGSHDVIVFPPQLLAWKALGIPAVLVDRGRPYREIVAQAGPLAPDALYYTPLEIEQKIDALVAAYPTLAKKIDLTTFPGAQKTVGNRSIWALKVSDNVATDEDEPAMLIAAEHHARELNSAVMVVEAMSRVLAGYAGDPQLKAVVDEFELYFVPCVNPDGTDYVWTNDANWRKNRLNGYGVDNNRNYPYQWNSACPGSTVTSSETYRGPSAGSEAETKTMIAANAVLGPEVYIDFHSYGQEVLFNYAPCITPNATLTAFLNAYITDLRTPMTYNTRAPSASGEAPHDHWASRGTWSFLIEVGTSFQPAYATTMTEEARVWPGTRRVLTAWRPAVRGHVRSIYQGQPIAASISYTPNYLLLGEKTQARARDGRYSLWVPTGSYQVTFSAPGFQPVTKSVTVASLNNPVTLEIEMVPAWTEPTLTKAGSDKIGTTTTFTYTSPGDAGDVFWVALAFDNVPGITIGSRTVPLNADGLLFATATTNPFLVGNIGVLPASASVQPTFPIPPLAVLIGLKVWAGGLTLAPGYPSQLKKFSPSISITFQP